MRIFAGPLRNGFTAILTALLLPVLGFGVAKADFNVGDTIMLKVPDLAEFPETIEEHQFTCRAVTEHAYWLVQDTISVREGTGPGSPDSLVWGNIFTQGELDTLTAEFEGAGVDVYGTVTEYLGEVPDTDGDPRLWIVLATMRDQYTFGGNPIDRKTIEYVNPADVDGSGTFNNQDIIYINIHTFTDNSTTLQIAKGLRRFMIPNGLGAFIRTAVRPDENPWVIRGIGEVGQYMTYGVTATSPGGFGVQYDIEQFAKSAFFEMLFFNLGTPNMDFAATRGQSFLWLMYLAQRQGDSILETVAQSDTTGMLGIARAIDPSVPDSTIIQTNVVPLYKDWLVCNLTSHLQDDMAGGIYRYDIFSDPSGYQFTHANFFSAFEGHFETGDYPLENWLPPDGLTGPIWAAQYCEFEGEYNLYPDFFFNGAYADANGSGSPIDGKWILFAVSVDTVGTDEIAAVEEVTLNDLYNGSFQLQGDLAYTIVTNNNPGGTANLQYVLSQDDDVPEVLMAAYQNSVNDQFITVYSTLYDSIPEGFDWYGPIFTAATSDSTAMVPMSSFYSTIWDSRFDAWESADYTLQVAGYDSAGFYTSESADISVGYASSGRMTLTVQGISLDVQPGAVAPGTMVSLCESSVLDLAVSTQTPVEETVDMMTGVLAGPVSIPGVNATLSFPAESSDGSVYRYTAAGWEKLDSYFQGGRMCANVIDGGIYAYGDAPGVTSPQIPAEFGFSGIYPNPFNAEAAIRFSLPSASRVSVTIYDMSGRAVRTLSDTEMRAAEHTLMWDGLDETGNPVGSGVYFCRLQAAGETVTQKMLRIE